MLNTIALMAGIGACVMLMLYVIIQLRVNIVHFLSSNCSWNNNNNGNNGMRG